MNDKQLAGHFIDSMLGNCMQIVFGTRVSDGAFLISGLCTWIFDHQKKHIKLIGLIGDKNLVQLMRDRWKLEYPYYSVSFMRRNSIRIYAGKQSTLS